MGGDPLGGGVDFVDRCRVVRLGRRCVIHEDGGEAAIDHKVTDETLMRWEIVEHPATTMDKDKTRQDCLAPRRADKGEVQFQSIL